jgi:hypothetical protein
MRRRLQPLKEADLVLHLFDTSDSIAFLEAGDRKVTGFQ